MTIAFIIAAVLAVVFLVLWVTSQQKVGGLTSELEGAETQLTTAKSEISAMNDQIDRVNADINSLEAKSKGLDTELTSTRSKLNDASDTLRKRTELADAQALQIDAISGERDELRQQLSAAEERIATLNARPGVVVGSVDGEADGGDGSDEHYAMLWNLEVARSERLWRTSVAIDPAADHSPFDGVDDPTRKAVEIEAAALREDVGALITIDWQAPPVTSPARRLLVVRVAQELLATAARAPGATRLLVTQRPPDSADSDTVDDGGSVEFDGELVMEFVAPDDSSDVINLIPPQISSDLVDVRNDAGLSVTVRSAAPVGAGTGELSDG